MEKMVAGAPVAGSNSSRQTYCNDQAMKFSYTKGDGAKNPAVPDGLTQDKQGNGPALHHSKSVKSRNTLTFHVESVILRFQVLQHRSIAPPRSPASP